MNDKPIVFISYSHKDEVWKERLESHLGVLKQVALITIWNDRQIGTGEEWYEEIKEVISRTAVAVCLISADFLNSNFCVKEEIPDFLERRKNEVMMLLPVLLRRCAWKAVPWLKRIQMLPRDGKSVANDYKDDWDVPFATLTEEIFDKLTDPNYQPPAPPPPEWPEPEKVDIDRLPVTGAELFGRQKALELLDEAWETESTNVVSLVAWGGVGKSTLVNKWLEDMAAENYRGARRVFGWSFYSQGTGERVTSADLFIAEALKWFGDDDPSAGSPWNKGERLAELVKREKTLLVLDGLEPLQSALEYERGQVKDPGLGILITELARNNPGLCVITTRETVSDLEPYTQTILQQNLEQISDEAGRALLRVRGVRGADAQLEAATSNFGNHALALNLLAAYLQDVLGHLISHAGAIRDLDIPVEKGRHPRRVIAAFEERFGDGPEVELLRILALFDRPAESEAIAEVRAALAIPNLTENLAQLSEAEWLRLLEKLRRTGLVAPESEHRRGELDAHPLVREYFGQQLRETYLDAWREGNNRLYEHLKETAKDLPDTIEEMAPLFLAVAHGCQAGRHQEALDEVYLRRILRGKEHFSWKKLGAFGADLAALSGFFELPWQQIVAGLSEDAKAFVVHQAGLYLQALGWLAEAAEPMQAGLEANIAQRDWENAATAASNLSQLNLTIGDLEHALKFAQQSVELADRSCGAFQRLARKADLAAALHQAGRVAEAESLFKEAEATQTEHQPEYMILYSRGGLRYCDLLLEQGKYQEVQERAARTLEWVTNQQWLLDIALDHLSLGRAHLLQAQQEGTGDFTKAAEHLNNTVEGLRQAAQQDYLPCGFLARAALYRLRGYFERARRDLEEAMPIATRGGMGLHQADAHLEYTRLYLAMEEPDKACDNLTTAKEMIERMGYHRRDDEVTKLEEQLR